MPTREQLQELSKEGYIAGYTSESTEHAHEIQRMLTCQAFGWTLDQYDNTDAVDLTRGLALLEGYQKARTRRGTGK